MRIAVMALALVACVACKDKQPAKQAPPAPASEPQATTPRPELETPTVTGPGLVPAVGLGSKVTMTKTELKVDEENIATLGPDGMIDKARLDALTRVLEGKGTSDAPVAIALDATVPYRRVGQLLDTLKRAGFRNVALLAGTGAQMIPIELPDSAEANGPGLRVVISLQRTQLRLWSVSGQEGTRRKPKLTMAVADGSSFVPLTRTLAEIVERRWPDGERAAADRSIIVELDGNQPAQTLLNLLAAVRADGTLELFPNILLAGGA